MKRNSQPTPQPTATVDDLRAQLDSIAAALSLETDRDKTARIEAAEAARVEREAAQYAQRQAALKQAAAVTAVVVDALQALDRGAFSALDSAVDALAVAGATSPPYTFPALVELRRAVTATLGRLADLDPVLMGKPAHPTAAELAIKEARRAVETAEATLAEVSRISYGGEGRALAVERAGEGLRLAQKRLSALTGESYTVQALQSRIARMVSTVPMRQPESELVS